MCWNEGKRLCGVRGNLARVKERKGGVVRVAGRRELMGNRNGREHGMKRKGDRGMEGSTE